MSFCTVGAQAQTRYAVTDVGTLGGSYSSAHAISTNGLVTGIATDGGGVNQVFIYALGRMQSLGNQGGTMAVGNGVNDSGEVAAFASEPVSNHALRYHSGRLQDIGDLGGGIATAYAINAQGNVVGSSRTADGRDAPFLYHNGVMTDLGTLGSYVSGQWNAALGVNDHRVITGTAWDASGKYQGFVWRRGVMRSLGTLGGTWSEGSAINNNNQITGLAYLQGDTVAHAFLWQKNNMTDLGALPGGQFSWGFGINDDGVVVGLSVDANNADRAVIVENGAMSDLNALIPQGSGWQLEIAYGINQAGQVVGEGMIGGQRHGFVLTPN